MDSLNTSSRFTLIFFAAFAVFLRALCGSSLSPAHPIAPYPEPPYV